MRENIPIDPPGLKGGPGRQAKLVQEYLGQFRVQGDNPPMIVAENGEAILSMMWPVHDQTPEGEQAAVEYVRDIAQKVADLLNENRTHAQRLAVRDQVLLDIQVELTTTRAERDALKAESDALKRERDELHALCNKLPSSPPGFGTTPADRLHWTANWIKKTWDSGKVLFRLREAFGAVDRNDLMLERVLEMRRERHSLSAQLQQAREERSTDERRQEESRLFEQCQRLNGVINEDGKVIATLRAERDAALAELAEARKERDEARAIVEKTCRAIGSSAVIAHSLPDYAERLRATLEEFRTEQAKIQADAFAKVAQQEQQLSAANAQVQALRRALEQFVKWFDCDAGEKIPIDEARKALASAPASTLVRSDSEP